MSASVVSLVGFTGPRDLAPRWRSRVASVVAAVAPDAPEAASSAAGIAVGDALGADAFVSAAARSLGLPLQVFRPSLYGGRRLPASLAHRSASMVAAVAAAGPGSFLVGFVSSPCPSEKKRGGGPPLAPSRSSSRCFAGYGSGSWASLALAVGLGLRVVVFPCGLPSVAALPAWWGRWAPAAASGVWSLGWSLVARG